MKAKFGSIVVDGSGKLGGHVIARNRGGSYFRTKPAAVNPDTSYQQTVRNRLATRAQAWRDLTQAQRDAWIAVVADFKKTDVFGDLRNPSGFDLYVRLNNNLVANGQAAIAVPPVPSGVSTVAIGALSIDIGVGDVNQIATGASVPAGTSMQVWMTAGLSPGIEFVKNRYRLVQVFAAAAASPHDVQAAYEARFGVPPAGTKVFCKIVFVDDSSGINSSSQTADTIVLDT